MISFTHLSPDGSRPRYLLRVVVFPTTAEYENGVAELVRDSLIASGGFAAVEFITPPDGAGRTLNLVHESGAMRAAVCAFDASRLDIETVAHEVRHAAAWFYSDASGKLVIDTLRSGTVFEEALNAAVDEITWSMVRMLTKLYGPLEYRRTPGVVSLKLTPLGKICRELTEVCVDHRVTEDPAGGFLLDISAAPVRFTPAGHLKVEEEPSAL